MYIEILGPPPASYFVWNSPVRFLGLVVFLDQSGIGAGFETKVASCQGSLCLQAMRVDQNLPSRGGNVERTSLQLPCASLAGSS